MNVQFPPKPRHGSGSDSMGCKGSRVQISAPRPIKTSTSGSSKISEMRKVHFEVHLRGRSRELLGSASGMK
jgi:hypothetical protein